MRYLGVQEVYDVVKNHPGLFMVEITRIAYPDLTGWRFDLAKQNVSGKLQRLKVSRRVRPIYTTTNQRNAGWKWEAVE